MIETITDTIIAALAKAGAEALARRLALGPGGKSEFRQDPSGETLIRHLRMVSQWASNIAFMDLKRTRSLREGYVDLDLELGRVPTRSSRREVRSTRVSDLLREDSNLVLLGDPGAGKSTSLQRLAIGFLSQSSKDPHKGPPLLIRLRELRSEDSLASAILEAIGVEIDYEDRLSKVEREKFRLRCVTQVLATMRSRVLLDGLDELQPKARVRITKELRPLLLFSGDYRVIISCRTAEFTQFFENAKVYAIEPLSDFQIEVFVGKWLGEKASQELLDKVRTSPYVGTEVLPLTLAHLCAIYERTGAIPDKPKEIYQKIVRLLLAEWDEQRSVTRSSDFADFAVGRKEEFLRALAFELAIRAQKGSIDRLQMERAYRKISNAFKLPTADSRRVIREVEAHTGLILLTAHEKYEFCHRSLQEYLAAEHIIRLAVYPQDLAPGMPNEMALVVGLSAEPNQYFCLIVESMLQARPHDLSGFSLPFLRRLFLEKVDFQVDWQLGIRITELFGATFFPTVGKLQIEIPFGVPSRVFREFVQLEGVPASIALALRKSRIEPNGGETWRVRWLVPKEYQKEYSDSQGVVVDAGFLELARLAGAQTF